MRAVLLDIGGVLELTPPTHWAEKWEARLGLNAGGLRQIVSPIWQPGRTGAASLADIERHTAEALGIGAADSDELWDDMWAWYVGTLNRELLDYLGSLRPRYQLAILSNSFVGAREREQALYNFAELFDPMIYSHEEGLEKPNPAFYQLACDRLGARAEEIVFVDDTAGHVAGAESVGMRGVVFLDTPTAITAIERHLHHGSAGSM